MLAHKVQKILLDNKFAKIQPSTMNQLAARIGISYKRLTELINRAREDDIERIAKALDVDSSELN